MKKIVFAILIVLATAVSAQAASMNVLAGAFAMGDGNIPALGGNGDQFDRVGTLVSPEPHTGPGTGGTSVVGFDFGFFGCWDIWTSAELVPSLSGSDLSGWEVYWCANVFNMGATNVNTVDNGDGTWTMDWNATVVGGSFDGQVGNWVVQIEAPTSDIPEPASMLLLGSGLAGLLGVSRRKK